MSTAQTKDDFEIYRKDWGKGQPIAFSHGWPLSADDWDNQMLFFLKQGYRVITHDRRGHGRSSQVPDGPRPRSLCRRSGRGYAGGGEWCAIWRGTATGAPSRCDHFGGAAADSEDAGRPR
jgi:pimeloyl-ACP methyl ester carboxylesterase